MTTKVQQLGLFGYESALVQGIDVMLKSLPLRLLLRRVEVGIRRILAID
jgi:hypothetical protein